MAVLMACLTLALLLATHTLAAAGTITTGGIPTLTDDRIHCAAVNVSNTTIEEVLVQILDLGGSPVNFARCFSFETGDICSTGFSFSSPANTLRFFSCRITASISSAKLRATLSNRTTGASSDAR